MRFAAALWLLTSFQLAQADDLDSLIDPKISPDARGEIFHRLKDADFPTIAPKLARLLGEHPIQSGIGARRGDPWAEELFNTSDRIAYTLRKLWHDKIGTPPTRPTFELMFTLLEDESIGRGRHWPMAAIHGNLHRNTNWSPRSRGPQ